MTGAVSLPVQSISAPVTTGGKMPARLASESCAPTRRSAARGPAKIWRIRNTPLVLTSTKKPVAISRTIVARSPSAPTTAAIPIAAAKLPATMMMRQTRASLAPRAMARSFRPPASTGPTPCAEKVAAAISAISRRPKPRLVTRESGNDVGTKYRP